MEMFEKAVRSKVRFEYRGILSVEDLWDLGESALNSIYGALKEQQRATSESLLVTKSAANELLELKIGLVKHVFDTKRAEADERKATAEKKEKKQKLLGVLERKQSAAFESMSEEDLKKLINEL